MDLLDLIKKRRSIRKYQDKQIPREDLEKIIEAGLYAPNAGGRQRTIIVGVHNKELTEAIGRVNITYEDRRHMGIQVSKEQPSILDDPTIENAFYGAPTVCVVFSEKDYLNSIPDAFCCAMNMILEATALGISSCIITRAEKTFESELGKRLLKEWQIPENYIARCFVILGYCEGEYPEPKPRREGRSLIIE
jgi:nitroreductase